MKDKKSQLDKEFEKVEALSQEGKRGVEDAKKILKEEEHEDKEEYARDLQRLDDQSHRSTIVNYNYLLANLLIKRLRYNDWPTMWNWNVAPTKEGIILELKSPNGRYFRNAFKPTGLPKYDLNAVEVYATRAQNTVDRLEKENYGPNNTQ